MTKKSKPEVTSLDRVRSVHIDPALHDAAKQYADEHGMSVSEVIREAMDSFTTGEYPSRKRVTRRVTMWIDPKKYAAFAKRARESKITLRQALETSLEKML